MTTQQYVQAIQPEAEGLSCEVVPERDRVRVVPTGSLDLATVAVLDDELAGLRQRGFDQLVIDLRALSFMDSTGLRLALTWHAAADRDGFALGFLPGPPQIQRVFELTGTLASVRFVEV